jgi:hypothetical protein
VTEVDRRETLVDAGLATLVLLAVVVVGIVIEARFSIPAAIAGSLGTVLAEAVAGRHERRVRRAWRRPAVKAAALVLAGGGIAGGVVLAPTPALSAAGGALLAYLLLVGLVAGSVVPPPAAWL